MANSVRQRPNNAASKSVKQTSTASKVEGSGRMISILDVLRVMLTLSATTLALSYYLTSGESFLFGYRPWFTKPGEVKQFIKGPLELTPQELIKFDGTNPDLPIYMAINGTIFDVSSSPHMYGPGGGYSVFAGRDATRAFVTGCFLEDRTTDLRGAEEVYLPIDDPNEVISSGDRKIRAQQERREAKKKVIAEVQKWSSFYSNSDKYVKVGKVVGTPEPKGPPPKLCAHAQKGRPKRQKPAGDAAAAAGNPVH